MPDFAFSEHVEQFKPYEPDPLNQAPKGYWDAMADTVMLQPVYQWIEQQLEYEPPEIDPTFSAFDDEETLRGYEDFYSEFLGVRDRNEVESIKERIDRNLKRRASMEGLGFGSIIATELVNPINFIPLPAFAGASAGRVALKGAASVGAVVAAEEAARLQLDPTATPEEAMMNTAAATAFGGLIGGVVGGYRSMTIGDDFSEKLAVNYLEETARRVERGEEVSTSVDPVFQQGPGTFRAQPTQEGSAGIVGSEGIMMKMLEATLPTVYTKLQGTGIQSVGDLANVLLGDFNLMLNKNKLGMATDESIYLKAAKWRGGAADLNRELEQLFTRWLTGKTSEGARFLDASPTVIASKFGNGPKIADFHDAIFRAHKRDGIDPNIDPIVAEGVKAVRRFFDQAEAEGMETGLLATKAGWARYSKAQIERARELVAEGDKLRAKKRLTNNEILVLERIEATEARIYAELQTKLVRGLDEDGTLNEAITKWEDDFKTARAELRETAKSIRSSGKYFRALIHADQNLLKFLNDLEVTRGLTKRQQQLRDDLVNRLDDLGERSPNMRDEMEFATDKQRAYLADIEAKLGGYEDQMFFRKANDPNYIARIWRADLILGREEELHDILVAWFKENPLDGSRIDEAALSERAWKAIDTILGQSRKDEMQLFDSDGASARFLNQRGIDIPNELVADFIETDVSAIARMYSQRFGVLNELTRITGSTDARRAINDVMIQAAREVDASDLDKARRQLDATEKDLVTARDKLTGKIYDTSEEATARRRAAQNIKGLGITTSMGTALISSLTEPARAFMVHGFGRTFGASLEMLSASAEFKRSRRVLQRMTGEGTDMNFMGQTVARYMTMGGPVGSAQSKAGRLLEKHTEFANGTYFKLNGLTPFTDIMKQWNNALAARFIWEDAAKIADGKANKKLVARMASVGIDEDMAKRIRDEKNIIREDGEFDLNERNWSDVEALSRFMQATAAMTRRSIVTPGLADIPEFAKGFIAGREYPLLTLPFQFLSWGFGAVNKIGRSGLQGRDQNAMGGALALFGMGYMIEALKTDEYIFDNMPLEEKMVRAFDRSGLIGVLSDIPTMVETATMGSVGLRPLIGLDPYVRDADFFDATGELGGPVVGKVADLVRLMVYDDTEVADVTGAVRRSIPLNNLFYWKGLFRDLERGTAEAIESADQ